MRWAVLCAGLLSGAANFLLLAGGAKRIAHGGKRGALWLLGGALVPVAGLIACALLSPALLPWFGCACAGTLLLLAVVRIAQSLRKK